MIAQALKIFLLSLTTVFLFSQPLLAQEGQPVLDEENVLSENFPLKGSVKMRVRFWKKVYTEINSNEAYLHDMEDMSIIYKKVKLPSSRRRRIRFLRKEKKNIRSILYNIAKKGAKNLNSKEQDIYNTIGHDKTISQIRRMTKNLRFQYGLRDRYYKGLIRSYEYLDFIKSILKKLELPDELVYLPPVESSFNYNAYSKVGAAGIWQFMRSTGRLYRLKVNYVVDERRDVFKATRAAARLLKDNYRKLKSWPLALTAYNHGARSMQRAVDRLKTREIHKIIDGYRGRRFGFASKNFYATFLATVIISKNPEKYFKEFKMPKPFRFSVLELKHPYTVKQISKALDYSVYTIGKYNPSIRRSALRSPLFLPKNFKLHVPFRSAQQLKKLQAKVDEIEDKTKDFALGRMHIISRGENLYEISRAYRVSLSDLIVYNQISNPSRIYAGMKLKIPGKDTKIKKVVPTMDEKLKETSEKMAENKQPKQEASSTPEIKEAPTTSRPTDKKEIEKIVEKAKDLKDKDNTHIDSKKLRDVTSLEAHNLEVKKVKNNLYRIHIETDETLGHIADWANLRTQKIRDWNSLPFGRVIHQGQRLVLYLKEKQAEMFQQKRNEYHLSIQEDFFSNYKVIGTKDYTVKRGDTVTGILKEFNLPFWLVRRYQEDQKLTSNIHLGQTITVPTTEALEDAPTARALEAEDESDEKLDP